LLGLNPNQEKPKDKTYMKKLILKRKDPTFTAVRFCVKKWWEYKNIRKTVNGCLLEINLGCYLPIEDGNWIVEEADKTSIYESLDEVKEVYEIKETK